jgi:hypothetical protein
MVAHAQVEQAPRLDDLTAHGSVHETEKSGTPMTFVWAKPG